MVYHIALSIVFKYHIKYILKYRFSPKFNMIGVLCYGPHFGRKMWGVKWEFLKDKTN